MSQVSPVGINITQPTPSAPKTHAGLKLATGLSALTVGASLLSRRFFLGDAIGMGLTLATGAAVDHFINSNREKFAAESMTKTKKQMLDTNDNADITRNSNLYNKTNTGKKAWTAIAASTGAILALINRKAAGEITGITLNPVAAGACGAMCGAVKGLIFGAVTDHFANKTAQQHADKQAITD